MKMSSSAFSMSLGALFGLVTSVTIPQAVALSHGLSAIPTVRIAEEQHMVESFDNIAEVVGTEKFYLKVGGMLHKKGLTKVGLFPDGQVVHSEDEHIEAQKIFEERGQTKEYHESHVFNPSLGELGSMLGQVSEFNKIKAAALKQRMIEIQKKVLSRPQRANESYSLANSLL